MNTDGGAEIAGAIGFAPQLVVATHAAIGIACIVISGVLIFDRAAATRAMFDNRVALGGLIVLCGLNHVCAVLPFCAPLIVMKAALMLATCVVSVFVAGLTLRALLVKRAAPA